MNHPTQNLGARLAGFALANAVPMNLVFIVLVFVGLMVIRMMPVDVYPDVSLGVATIDTAWLGASAEDVERMITDRIEDKIQDIRGIAWTSSDSRPDVSRIRVQFREGLTASGVEAAMIELRAAVEQVVDLPEDAIKPIVTKITTGEVLFLLWVTIIDEADVGEEVLHDVALRLKPILREIEGVAKVDDALVRDREVHIKTDRDAMRRYRLTLHDLAEILRQYNRNLPSGTIEQADSELTIRARGGVISPYELGSIVVRKDPAGGHVYLRDVARIETGFARKTFFARCGSHDCLGMGIVKSADADSRIVADRVREALPAFEAALPPGVGLEIFNDNSDIIRNRLQVLMSNLTGGVVLVFLTLLLSVGFRNSVLAIVGIPFSFGCALICMHALGVTINAVSLIALVLCSGMIVDDAIVVLENIYRHIESELHGQGRAAFHQAIIDGTAEVIWPVMSSSLTTIAAFLPLLLMSGVAGDFFSLIPKTVTVVLLASLFECLLVLPVHYLDFGFRKASRRQAHDDGAAEYDEAGRMSAAKRFYNRCLTAALQHRYFVPLPLFALMYLSYAALPLIDTQLFPPDQRLCFIDFQTADEASLDLTGEAVRKLEHFVVAQTDLVAGVLTSYGMLITEDYDVRLGGNVAQMHVELARTSQFQSDPTSVTNTIRERTERFLAEHPGSGIRSFRVWAPQAGPPAGKPVYVRIDCPDFRVSQLLAEQYRATLAQMDGVFGISDNLEFGRQQINLVIDEDRASVHGLTFLALASLLRTANDGLVVSTFKDTQSGEDLDVRLRLDDRYCRRVEDLMDLDIRSMSGDVIQVRQIAEVTVAQGYAGIPHYDGRRTIVVMAEVDQRQTSSQDVNARLQQKFAPIVAAQSNVRVTYGGQFAEIAASFSSLREAFVIAVVLIYMLLATQFRSYVQPAIILSTVPFASIGVIGGLLLSGYPFTVMTFIAIVGMSGVVVNDSILLVDCANAKRREHADVFEAVRVACLQRLRPVILTTVTTVVGLLPLALGLGGKTLIWSPFAASFAWGLSFATLVTLIIVPVVYCMVDDFARWFRRGRDDEAHGSGLEAGEAESDATGGEGPAWNV